MLNSLPFPVIYIGIGSVIALLIITPILYFKLKKLKLPKTPGGNPGDPSEKIKSDIILSSIADGVVVINERFNIQLLNPAASALTGWPIQEASGMDYHTVIQLVDDKGVAYIDQDNAFARVFVAKEPIRDATAYLKTRSNKSLPISLIVTPIKSQDGRVIGAVGVFRDVSQERSEERQRAEFISTASHEMRTPVAAIEGYLALAMNDKVSKIDDKAREFLVKAHSSTQHLGQLFQDLLTSAKAEDGRLSSHPIAVEVGHFLEQLSEDLRFGAEKKGLQVEYVLGSDDQVIDATAGPGKKAVQPLYYVHADPDRLREVITNIFDNAVKYTDRGKVSLGLTGDVNVVQIRVSDTGPGIPAEDIPHLFQKFYRVDNSSTRTIGGTGLGLFICRKIIELYHGKIWVESRLGEGSTFFINLPRITADKALQLQQLEASPFAQLNNPQAMMSNKLPTVPAPNPQPVPSPAPQPTALATPQPAAPPLPQPPAPATPQAVPLAAPASIPPVIIAATPPNNSGAVGTTKQ